MSSPTHGGDLPPDVPEEYGAAYRAAYEKALRDLEGGGQEPDPVEDFDDVEVDEVAEPEPRPVPTPGAHAAVPGSDETRSEYRTRPGWLIPLAFAAGALVLIGSAYFLGRMVSGTSPEADATPKPSPSARETTQASADPTPTPETSATPAASAWKGEVAPVAISGVKAGCTSRPGVDSSGARVTYAAKNTIDGDTATAWRCDGRAVGKKLTISVPAGTRLAEVGLIPGYAKTDAKSGANRYAENNRITRVRWILSDGSEVVQAMSADPKDRSLRTMRIPPTETGSVTLEIVDVAKGKRNTTMISEISLQSTA